MVLFSLLINLLLFLKNFYLITFLQKYEVITFLEIILKPLLILRLTINHIY